MEICFGHDLEMKITNEQSELNGKFKILLKLLRKCTQIIVKVSQAIFKDKIANKITRMMV